MTKKLSVAGRNFLDSEVLKVRLKHALVEAIHQ